MALEALPPGRLEHRQAVAEARRSELEGGIGRWLPGGRQRLEAARAAERRLGEQLGDARRDAVEDHHRSLPFVTERERYAPVVRARERRIERDVGRDLGR